MAANDGNWHHICVSWTNSDASWQLYNDGELTYSKTGFQTRYTIKCWARARPWRGEEMWGYFWSQTVLPGIHGQPQPVSPAFFQEKQARKCHRHGNVGKGTCLSGPTSKKTLTEIRRSSSHLLVFQNRSERFVTSKLCFGLVWGSLKSTQLDGNLRILILL